jgi:lipoprotein-anchoring transpeptidase ErfK/SrfK
MRLSPLLVAPVAALLLAACTAQANPVQQLAAVTHKAPLAPVELQETTADGHTLSAKGWTNQSVVRLAASLSSPEAGASLVPEVEFLPADQPFTGTPNAVGKAGDGFAQAPSMAAGQQYHWQMRARDGSGPAGPWVPFDGTLGFDPTPPPSPSINALPNDGNVTSRQLKVAWDAVAGKSGIAGFAFSADQAENGQPAQQATSKDPSATVTLGADGEWYVHVRTLDNAGNWSPTATIHVHLDTIPLNITDPFYRTYAYNPGFDTLPMAFSITKPAHVVLTILPDKADTPLRTYDVGNQPTGKVKVEWDGKDDRGAVVPPGNYRFRVVATDKNGTKADALYDQLLVSQKRIVVSLSQEKMWAYDGDKVAFETLVTTGNLELPTPVGTFQILTKQKDFVFHSPWPKGNKFWYPDSPTKFAMMFDDGGYFIHDAPWRHKFGPGSNLTPGQPGEDITGPHGCVNVPSDVQAKLFAWTDLGTPVVVQQ